MRAFRRNSWSVPLACIPPLSVLTNERVNSPRGSSMIQWLKLWSEWDMENDRTENRETVASWLTPPAHKTRKTKTTTDYFYYKINPRESVLLKSSGSHADVSTRQTGTHSGLSSGTHLRFMALSSQTLL